MPVIPSLHMRIPCTMPVVSVLVTAATASRAAAAACNAFKKHIKEIINSTCYDYSQDQLRAYREQYQSGDNIKNRFHSDQLIPFLRIKACGALSYLSYGLQYIQEFLFTFLYMVNVNAGKTAIFKFAGN